MRFIVFEWILQKLFLNNALVHKLRYYDQSVPKWNKTSANWNKTSWLHWIQDFVIIYSSIKKILLVNNIKN